MADATRMPAPKIQLRYIIWSDTLGVFLGRERVLSFWSLQDAGYANTAPTFSNIEYARKWVEDCEMPPGWRLIEVWPDKPNFMASPDAVANANLPRW